MEITLNYYPNGYKKAVTLSYDDGQLYDRHLIEILNKYGVKSTFHLNTARLDSDGFVNKNEINTLYLGHEVALHTHSHSSIAYVPKERVVNEVIQNRIELEYLTGNVINGMSYPCNSFNDDVVDVFKQTGVLYSRTTKSTGQFFLPDDFMRWNPTIHHSRGIKQWSEDVTHSHTVLLDTARKFIDYPDFVRNMPLLYIWGHSYEFENDNTWDVIEEFCKYISKQDVWLATNIEIYNYVTAMRKLRFSADCSIVYNPADIDVWIGVDDKPVKIMSGRTVDINKLEQEKML